MRDSSDIWAGNASSYDRARPTPPPALLDLLTQMIGMPHPALVVDVGSGTGLSTAIWGERAQRVIGIEPNTEMRNEAVHNIAGHPFTPRSSIERGWLIRRACRMGVLISSLLPSRSTGWNRLRPWLKSHVSCALVDCSPPTTMTGRQHSSGSWSRCTRRWIHVSMSCSRERGLAEILQRWSKETHLDRMRESGHFRFTREVLLHHIESGDSARFIEMTLTNGYSHQFQLKTITEQEIRFDRLRSAALHALGSEPIPWYFSYRVRIGIK